MAIKCHMTWVPGSRRWTKKFAGAWHSVSCKKLGVPETKEASWRAANEWWEARRLEVAGPSEDERVTRARQIAALVRDFRKLDEAGRREAIDGLLGAGSYDDLAARVEAIDLDLKGTSPGRATAPHVEAWLEQLRSSCQAGLMSAPRYASYMGRIRHFAEFAPSLDAIGEAGLDGFYALLTSKMVAGTFSPSTAHETMVASKQFVRWLVERRLIAMPANIDSRRFRFKNNVAKKIEVYTAEEVREMLAKAGDRLRLYLLLMLNCGMYQNDIAELRSDEVDWEAGTITRRRSKTRRHDTPVVTYAIWPETLALLRSHRAEGDLALTTPQGTPLVEFKLREGKFYKYDAIWPLFRRNGGGRLGLKHLRKTGSTTLAKHPMYKFYANHYLADSPKSIADSHYVVPSDEEFAEALAWLRGRLLGAEGSEPPP